MTTRQRLFIEHYKACRNASKAALEAGFSSKSAHITGSKLLKRPPIAKILAEWEEIEAKRLIPPTKQDYTKEAFTRSREVKHAPTAAKYFEIGGKASGFLSDDSNRNDAPTFNIIAAELNITLGPGQNTQKLVDITNTSPTDIVVNADVPKTNDANVQ